jgi:hypothetical protein
VIDANAIRIVFALQAIEPFDRLTAGELLLVSQHVRHRRFEPGALLLAEGAAAETLFVTLSGEALAGTAVAEPLFDASSVLFALPARSAYSAGPSGLEALCLAKSHLFTIARECPDFIVGLASLGARRRT